MSAKRPKAAQQPQFPVPELHINHEEHTHIHLLSPRFMWLLFGNAWAILWIALPVCRPADALVSMIVAGYCFYKAATAK